MILCGMMLNPISGNGTSPGFHWTNGRIYRNAKQMTTQDDIVFLNAVRWLAGKHGLEIDWEQSDIENRMLQFKGDKDEFGFQCDLDDLIKKNML